MQDDLSEEIVGRQKQEHASLAIRTSQLIEGRGKLSVKRPLLRGACDCCCCVDLERQRLLLFFSPSKASTGLVKSRYLEALRSEVVNAAFFLTLFACFYSFSCRRLDARLICRNNSCICLSAVAVASAFA